MMSEVAIVKYAPSVLWGSMIVCGTVVGAGMFTLPIVMAGAWYSWSTLILIISWSCMLMTGLMFHRVSQNYPANAGYDTITRDLLGNLWAEINGLSIIFVLGILTYTYISASGPVYENSLNEAGLNISSAQSKIITTITVAFIVWIGTSSIGRLMSLFLIAKIFLLLSLFGGLLTTVDGSYLFNDGGHPQSYWPYALGVVPFCLASFGYHGNIASLINYYEGDFASVRKCLFSGTGLALAIYLFWITSTMGNIPRNAFPGIIQQGGDVAALMQALNQHIRTLHFTLILNLFSHFAVLCSFLGVTAGLVDYISDRFNLPSTRAGRLKATFIAFFPPLCTSLFFPNGFVAPIGYAGLLATLWAVIVPGLLYKKAKSKFSTELKKCLWDKAKLIMVMSFAGLTILSWLLNELNLLPTFA